MRFNKSVTAKAAMKKAAISTSFHITAKVPNIAGIDRQANINIKLNFCFLKRRNNAEEIENKSKKVLRY